MDWDAVVRSAVIGGVGGGLAVLLIALVSPRRTCPGCGYRLPKFRRAATGRQALWGGWTCPGCGCEVDRKGKKVGGRDEQDDK
jgi:hypothetical protein